MSDTRMAQWSRYLIYFILAVLPLERIPSLELTHPISATIRLSQVAGLILIALNVPLLWKKRGQLLQAPWFWLVLFLCICLLSTSFALDIKRAIIVSAFTGFVAVLAWTIALRLEKDKLNTYAKILIISALATCLFGLYQFFGDLMGLSTAWTGLRPQYTSLAFGFPRIQSTGLEPLYYDDFLLFPAGLLIAYLIKKGRSWKMKWLSLALISTIVFMSVSRGAIVALLIMTMLGTGWALLAKSRKVALQIITAIGIGVVIAVSLISLGSHITTNKNAKSQHAVDNFAKQATNVSNGESSEFRTISRHIAIKTFEQHPLLGVGPGNFGVAANKIDPKNFEDTKAIVNNEPLEILAETGCLGILTFLGFVLSLAIKAWRIMRSRAVSKDVYFWVIGLLLALIAIAAQYQLFSTLYITHIWVAVGFLAGLTFAPPSVPNQTKKSPL